MEVSEFEIRMEVSEFEIRKGLTELNRSLGGPLSRDQYRDMIDKLIGPQPKPEQIEDLMEAVRRRRLRYALIGRYE